MLLATAASAANTALAFTVGQNLQVKQDKHIDCVPMVAGCI
jgi:hypothetical protein